MQVGTGFSTADNQGYIFSEDQMGEDFLGFLSNLVQVFPSLAKRPLYLTGEVRSFYPSKFLPFNHLPNPLRVMQVCW